MGDAERIRMLEQRLVEAEEAIRTQTGFRLSENILRAVFEGSMDGIVVADDDAVCVDANPAALELFGLRREELLGRDLLKFHVGGDPQVGTWKAFLETGTSAGHLEVQRADGEVRAVEFRARAHIMPGRHLLVLLDVTDRRRAEEGKRQAEQRFERLVEAAPDAVVLVDQGGRIVEANRQAEQMFGYEPRELIGCSVELLVPKEDRAAHVVDRTRYVRGPAWRAKAPGRPLRAVRKDGGEFPVEISLGPIEDGDRVLVAAAIRDISDRRRLEHQLAQASKMEAIGRLAGGIAHDFNNLLSVILTYATFASERAEGDEEASADLSEVVWAARRASTLTNQLLAFARQRPAAPVRVQLEGLVERFMQMLRRLIGEDVQLVADAASNLWPVIIDPTQLEQVVMNMAVNARDAMPEGGTLTLEVRNVDVDEAYAKTRPGAPLGPHVRLAVQDTGTGMSREVLERVFDPFFTTKPAGKGTGLGLSTSFGIVRQAGGHVSVQSWAGRGSRFEVLLPRAAGDSGGVEAASEHPEEELLRGSETIFVVEDDAAVLRSVERGLQRLGYTVLTAPGPLEALALLGQYDGPIDLLLSDVIMPHMPGPELVRRARRKRPNLRAMLMTGYDGGNAPEGSGLTVLQKPIQPKELAFVVREKLDQPSPSHLA